ncbi:hypothetical protein DY000_02021060 [Brassica cretica]|uniref:Uncharacterized protein n=1 Tax=Brassica cretica TaxID=69181 RepID=A0ABQ7E834_BRACR|nr:hypothetical protein DY000_02021060 [Brassica cretica]
MDTRFPKRKNVAELLWRVDSISLARNGNINEEQEWGLVEVGRRILVGVLLNLNVQQASEDARVWNKLNKDQGRDDVGNDLLEENKKWKPPISGFAKSNIHSTWKNAKLYSGGVFVIRDFTCNVLLHHARMNLLITEQVNNGASMFIMGSSKYEGSGLSKGGHWV